MKKNKLFLFINFLLFFFLTSCSKQLTSANQDELNISQLKKIVGTEGLIIKELPASSSIITNSIQEINKQASKTLTLDEFSKIYQNIKASRNKKIELKFKEFKYQKDTAENNEKIVESKSTIKSFDMYEDAEDGSGPRVIPQGYYVRENYGSWWQNNNGNSSIMTTMSIVFNTDTYGRVVGSPSLIFSGITLFTWNQSYLSPISYNLANHTSTFIISGTATYGISMGGTVLGWVERVTYQVVINTDYNSQWLARITDITTP
ncbi:MAG: hypothetical protein D4R91_07685 [Sediminibacterium sp.]|jgi:hypothetical protein|nr:MAG: hypothetical protein D4R91_07685 [Sediminibacterium sp.]